MVGLGPAYREANEASLYTVEAHVRYLDEVSAGSDLEVRSSVIGATGKLLWIWHELWVDDRLRATEEILGVHVPGAARRRSRTTSRPAPVQRSWNRQRTPAAGSGRSLGRIGPVSRSRRRPACR